MSTIKYSDDGTVLLSCPDNYEGEVIIPPSVKGIMARAFSGCSRVTGVRMKSVQRIGERAFKNCRSMKYVWLSDSVVYVGESVFDGCKSLQDVRLSSSLKILPKYAFAGCDHLQNLKIPSGVSYVASNAFRNCYALSEVVFDDDDEHAVTLENNVFFNCFSLRKVILRGLLNECAFDGCHGVDVIIKRRLDRPVLRKVYKKILFDYGVLRPNSLRGVKCGELVFNTRPDTEEIGDGNFSDSPQLIQLNLNERLKIIGKNVGVNCGIKELLLPDSLEEIGSGSFCNCENLSSVSISAKTKYDSSVFLNCAENLTIKKRY